MEFNSFPIFQPRCALHPLGLGPHQPGSVSVTLLFLGGVPIPNFAVKWLPCGCQKLLSTVLWYLDTNSSQKKMEFNSFPTFSPRCELHRLGLGPRPLCSVSETLLFLGGVPIPNFAVKWLPCGCQKLQPTVLWYLNTNSSQKMEFNSFPPFLPRCALHPLGLGPRQLGSVSETLLFLGGAPIPNFAVKWLPCGCQKLQPTVLWYSNTNSSQKN